MFTQVKVASFNQDQMYNIECPSVVLPGSYFTCKIWFFNSEHELIKVDLWDKENNLLEDTTEWLRVPEKFSTIPGGQFPSIDIKENQVLRDTTIRGVIITSTRFPFAGNVTALLLTLNTGTVHADVIFLC